MAGKTVTLEIQAYEQLPAARSHPRESFSDVILRARSAEETVTGAELLTLLVTRGPLFSLDELEATRAEQNAQLLEDTWTGTEVVVLG